MANNNVMKITTDDFLKAVKEVVNNRMMTIAGALAGREPNEEDAPYRPGPGDGKPPWPGYPKPYEPKLAKEPQLPNFKPMGPVIKGVREGVLPMKDTKIKQQLQIGPQAKVNYGKPTKLDNYFKEKGYPTRDDPDWLRLQIMRGAPKAKLPANNIRRLQDTGHMTIPQNPDGTGPLRIIDLLGPQNPPQA